MSTASLRFPAPAAAAAPPLLDPADLRGYAFTFLFRGSVVLTAALTNYLLEYVGFAAPWLSWVLLMSLAALLQAIRGRRESRRRPASTAPAAKTMRLLQKSFVVVILLAVVSATKLGWATVHPLLLLLVMAAVLVAYIVPGHLLASQSVPPWPRPLATSTRCCTRSCGWR